MVGERCLILGEFEGLKIRGLSTLLITAVTSGNPFTRHNRSARQLNGNFRIADYTGVGPDPFK